MAGITTGFSERFGDDPMAFEMKRFEDSEKTPLWRFRVTKYCGSRALIEQDASPESIRKMIAFLQRSLETLQTDGGRLDLKP